MRGLAPSLYPLQVGCRQWIPRLGSMPPGSLSKRGACGRGRESVLFCHPRWSHHITLGFRLKPKSYIFLNRDPDLGNSFMHTPVVCKESIFPKEPLVPQWGSWAVETEELSWDTAALCPPQGHRLGPGQDWGLALPIGLATWWRPWCHMELGSSCPGLGTNLPYIFYP